MARNIGVTFSIGAKLGASVSSAFASVQDKLRATQKAMRMASGQQKSLGNVLDIRARRDAVAQEIRQKGSDAALRKELRELSLQYKKAASDAGVYGASVAAITRRQYELEQAANRSQRRLNALQTVQQGRDMRNAESQRRKTAIGNAVADVLPLAGIAVPIKIGMEFDAAMSKVRAISGAAGAQFDALRAQARELGASTVWSASEAAEGMTFLSMAGFKTSEVMQAMPGMLSLASAGAMDLGATADIASNILSGFGFKADRMGHVGDILAKTFTSSNTSIASLGESFKYCAPVAANAGQAFESVAAMIGKLGDAGIQGSMAGTGLNAIIGRLAKPPKEAATALKKLGVSIANARGEMRPMEDVFADVEKSMARFSEKERIALSKALYGAEHFAKGMVLQAAAVDGSLYALRDSLKNVDDGYTDEVASQQNDNLLGDFRQLKSASDDLAISISDSLSPALRKIVGGFTPMVAATSRWVQANPGLVQGLTMLAGAFVGLKVAGLTFTLLNSYRRTFVGGMTSMRGHVAGAIGGVRNAFGAMRVELTRPVGIQVEQAKAGLSSLRARLDALRHSAGRAVSALRSITPASIAAGAAAARSGTAAAAGRAGWNILRLGIRGVGMAFKTMFGPMSLLIMGMSYGVDYVIENWSKIGPFFTALWEGVRNGFNAALDWIRPIAVRIADFTRPITDTISSVAGWFGEKWNSFFGNDEAKARVGLQTAMTVENAFLQAGYSQGAVQPAQEIAVKTTAQARAAEEVKQAAVKPAAPEQSARQVRQAAEERKEAAPVKTAAPRQAAVPQVNVSVNITQNGVPDKTFAQGVVNAIKSDGHKAIEEIISRIVGNQARLAYGS